MTGGSSHKKTLIVLFLIMFEVPKTHQGKRFYKGTLSMLTIPMVKTVETEEKKTLNHLKQKREYSLTTIEHFERDKGFIIIRIVFLSIPTRPVGQVNGCDTALSMGSFSVIDCQTRPR